MIFFISLICVLWIWGQFTVELQYCVGHTAWAPEGCEGRSQGGPKGRRIEVEARRAPQTSNFQYFRFFVSFLLSSLDVNIVLLNFKETTLKYSPRQNFVFDLESINWCDQIVEELSLIQSRIIVTEKLMIIPLLTTVLYVGKTIVIRNALRNAQIHKNTQKKELWVGNVLVFLSAHSSSRQVSC